MKKVKLDPIRRIGIITPEGFHLEVIYQAFSGDNKLAFYLVTDLTSYGEKGAKREIRSYQA